MKISCPNCSAAYELDDNRVPPAGLSIKCPKCKNPFTVHKPKPGEAGAKPAKPRAVPLPGQAGAKPKAPGPGKPPGAKAPPRAAAASDAVPLPGMGEGAATAPSMEPPPGAVPLPGLDEAPRSPPSQASDSGERVPLPGMSDEGQSREHTAVDFRPPPARAAPPAPEFGAVPLPGLDDHPPAPAAAGGDPFANLDFGAPTKPAKAPAPPPPAAAASSMDDVFSVDMPEPAAPSPKPPPATLPDDGGMNFDFVEPRKPAAAPSAAGGGDMLDFVDEAPKAAPRDERKRPPPPMIAPSGRGEQKEETLSLAEPGGETAPSGPEDPKKTEKERRKKERADRVARDRQERTRRKAAAGPGVLATTILPALQGGAQSLKNPKVAAGAVAVLALIVVVVLGVRARRTPAGIFWTNKFVPSKKAATATEAKVIEKGMERLSEGDFAGARDALGASAQLLGVLPDDEDVKAFFVLSASELKIAYAQVGGDWDQAKRVVEKMKANRPAQNRARGAFALASGDVPKAKQLLAPLGDAPNADVESAWLYAEALMAGTESAKAAQVLDNALKGKGQGSAKLLLLRGQAARQKGQFAEAATLFGKALEKSPENGRVLVELAGVELRLNDPKKASDLLTRALDTDVRKSLDATEEARANMLRGRLSALTHDGKAAEAAYERAVSLDPNAPEIHVSYGEFRLARREWEKAARQFDAAIGTGHASAAAYAGAALAYLGTNRLLEADKRINEAASREADNAHYIYLQGRVAEAIGKGEEAFKRYEQALQKRPDLAEALAAEGMVFLNRGDKPRAQEKLEAALKTDVANRSSLEEEEIGDLALALGDKQRGREAYARALQKDPEDPLAHSGMGKAMAAMGDLPAARKEMELALSQVEGDASMQYEYGSLLRRMGESDAALEALRKSVKLDSKDPRIRARLGAILVERGQYEEAEQQLRQAVLMNDRFAEGLYFLARALAGRKSLAEAVDMMKRAVEIEADNSEYLLHLGLIYEMGQQVQDAVESFQKSIERNPKNADAYEHLGINLMVENRFGEAVAAFKKAAELDPRRARIWAEVGDAEQQSGNVDGAIRDFEKALAMDASLAGVWTKLGIAFKDKDCKGCRTKALDALKRATHSDPTDATAHHELGYMLKDDGKRREALAEFRRYLELRPDAGDISTVQDVIFYLQEESRRSP